MNVLIDLHHEDLFYSLQLLFQKRLGMNVYRPIGLEWYHEGFWHIFPHINTANQYLSTDGVPPLSANGVPVTEEHGEGAWINKDAVGTEGLFHVPDNQHANPIHHRGVTLQAFKDMEFDLIVASIPKHLKAFRELRDKYQPRAKLIFQAGNNWGSIRAENLLTSSKKTHSSLKDANEVFYHQEFDLSVFKPGSCKNPKSIMNLQHLSTTTDKLKEVVKYLPGWELYIHGAGSELGAIPALEIPQKIRDVGFVWHVKRDEGYGYNIHHSFACGRPMIVDLSGNQGMTPADLYQEMYTVLDVRHSPRALAEALKVAADNHDIWCENVYTRFKEVVNFDEEEQDIRKFLENLR